MRTRGTWRGTPALIAALVVASGCSEPAKPSTGLIVRKGPVASKVVDTGNRPPRDTGTPNEPPNGKDPTPAKPNDGGGATPSPAVPSTAPTPPIGTLPTPPSSPTPSPKPSSGGSGGGGNATPAPPLLSGLFGTITGPAPILSNNGGAILSNNGSAILSNNGAAILSNNGGALISNNGSSIVSDAGTSYRLLGVSSTSRALTSAFVYLTNRDEKYYLDASGQVLSTTVDANGNYQFASGFPVGKDVIANALANGNLRLTGFGVPAAGGLKLDINFGTTLATEFLRGDAYRQNRSLLAYDQAQFQNIAGLTQQAVLSGDLDAVRSATDGSNNETVGRFDLRADHTGDLRNQYVIAFSAVSAGNSLLKQISDAWKQLLGERPTSVTSLLGNGEFPEVVTDVINRFREVGFATGDQRGLAQPTPPDRIPLGFVTGVAVAKRGDIFVACSTRKGNSGHIRWIHPNGKINTIWLPTYGIGQPRGICVEREPTDNPASPGSLLIADPNTNTVVRAYLIDEAIDNVTVYPGIGFGGIDVERHFMEIVAGENKPAYPADDPYVGFLSQGHPFVLAPSIGPAPGGNYVEPDTSGTSGPLASRWRYADEGARLLPNGVALPLPARYAHLDAPADVEVDELGNIYIADLKNHRIRFIPNATALAAEPDKNFFDYREPQLSANQEVEFLRSTKPAMAANAIYTIAGNPLWEPNNAKTPPGTSRWFGDYAGDNGPAQLAKLDSPYALAFNRTDKCLYFTDTDNNRVRKISRDTGVITTVVGNPSGSQRSNGQGDSDFTPDYGGDGGPAVQARLGFPRGLAFDSKGRLYVADTNNGLIRVVDTAGVITTVAGRLHTSQGESTDNADDGDARHYVDLYETEHLAVDPQDNVVFTDARHGRVRKLWRQWE